MANIDNPHGLAPVGRCMGGGPPRIDLLSKIAGYGTALFLFDAVNRVADGSIEGSATPGTTLYSGVNLNYAPASTGSDHYVITSADALYEAQDNGSAGVAAIDLGANANLVLTAGNATSGISKHQIATSSINTTSTLDLKLLALFAIPGNAHGANARIVVMFNKHRMNPAVAGV